MAASLKRCKRIDSRMLETFLRTRYLRKEVLLKYQKATKALLILAVATFSFYEKFLQQHW